MDANNIAFSALNAEVVAEYNQTRTAIHDKLLCHAPFKSMYFGHHGRVHSCCYNRNHILGYYPHSTIHDIWFGEQANRLRNYISNNDLRLGCHGCKEQLIAGNFDAVKARQYDERKLNESKMPSVMEFELSNTCNLECEMCTGEFSSLIRTKREKLPPLDNPYDSNFVDQLEAFIPYLEEVKFYGGEPFLIEIYYRIWDKIMTINPGARISVQTNGTTLNSRIKNLLDNTNFHISVSIDSLQKETYELIRKNAVLERTLENIKWFRDYCSRKNTFFGISVCAMQQNWIELPHFVAYCNSLNVPVYFHTVVTPEKCSIRYFPSVQLKNILDHLSSVSLPYATAIEKKNKLHYEGLIRQFEKWHTDSLKNIESQLVSEFDDFQKLMLEFVARDKSVAQNLRPERARLLAAKLTQIKTELGDAFFSEHAHLLNIKNPDILEVITNQIEQMAVPDFIAMARANAAKHK